LIGGRGVQNLGDSSSFPNLTNLIVIEAGELAKKPGWLGGVVRGLNPNPAKREEKQGEQDQTRPCGRDPSWYCPAIFLIGLAKFLFQAAFLNQNHIRMAEEQPSR